MKMNGVREWNILFRYTDSQRYMKIIIYLFYGNLVRNIQNMLDLFKTPFACWLECFRVSGLSIVNCVWKRLCHKRSTSSCNRTNEFRDIFWKKLILRFGLEYFMLFISYSPDYQLEMLFSGCRGILSNEVDILDCLKIFVIYLAKIQFNSAFAVMV